MRIVLPPCPTRSWRKIGPPGESRQIAAQTAATGMAPTRHATPENAMSNARLTNR